MSHQLQVIGRAEAARSSSHNRHIFARGRRTFRRRHISGSIRCHSFQSPYVDRVIDHISAAQSFARVLADKSAGRREWIVFADQPYGILITFFSDQCYVSRNIYSGRTPEHTRHRLIQCAQTTVIHDVFQIIFLEADSSFVHHIRCLITNGAVR